MKATKWLKTDRKDVHRAIAAGEPVETCSCCGGALPPYQVWEKLRQTGRGPDCDGAVDSDGNCRAFAGVMS